jgi:sugar phosphate isomerase/epimerase
MRLGTDALKFPGAADATPLEIVERAHAEGLDGVFFRTILTMSETLDTGELGDIRSLIDDHGMYLEAGLGKVNPFGTPETPELRAIGDGDIVLGFRRMMEAAVSIGIHELWVATANIKPYAGRLAYDRFRTDVAWADQLVAIEKFLRVLAPIARDLGVHMNLETHEEITSFELVRLVEAVGPDVTGITFDTANVLQRAEHPTWAARRVAPYVRQSHIKDAALFHAAEGAAFQMRPVGEGLVSMEEILPVLAAANPALNLSLEIASERPVPAVGAGSPRKMVVSVFDPLWIAGHPDLTVEEFAAWFGLVQHYADRVAAGLTPGFEQYRDQEFGLEQAFGYLRTSAMNVRSSAHAVGVMIAPLHEGGARGVDDAGDADAALAGSGSVVPRSHR